MTRLREAIQLSLSAIPPIATELRTLRQVRKVPTTDVAFSRVAKKKPPEGGSSNLMIADQANAGFDLRRSGTEATCSGEYQVSPTLICGA
jgi:hypothetical protein